MKGPVEVLASLLQDVGSDLGKQTSPWRVAEKPPAMGRKILLIIIWFNFNAGGERGREGRDDFFTRRREHVAQGVWDHGSLLIDDELKTLGADELDEACGLLVVAVTKHGGRGGTATGSPLPTCCGYVMDLSAVAAGWCTCGLGRSTVVAELLRR
jgi:hypothetical protein